MTLVSHWPFDEDSGTTATDVKGSNNGTISGATVGVTGILGTTAYSFDGTNDGVSLGSIDFGLTDNDPVSFVAWINTSDSMGQIISVSNERIKLCVGDANTNGTVASGDVAIAGYDGTHRAASTTLPTNQWVHVVGTFDGSTGKIYVDGIEKASATVAYALTGNPTGIMFDPHNNQNYLSGDLDGPRVYDHVLTPAEIQYLYQAKLRGTYLSSVKTS